MEFVRDFHHLTKKDVLLAGGKGASLGEMTKAGLPVPEGFVLLAPAFERFLKETELLADIDASLHQVDVKEMHTIEQASEKIRAAIMSEKMPEDIAQEIKNSFKKLKCPLVAVRSSATAEDSSAAAWAGQLDTFLNTPEKLLLENVQQCWASLFTPRAIFYRFEKNLHNQKISVAVVIQKMIESEVAGVAFSVHPVTRDKNQLIIEACLGLGEAVVSGQITPDSYVVEKRGWLLIEKNISEQKKGLYLKKSGGNEWKKVNGKKQKLSDQQIKELAQLVVKIEKHYDFPCDIEWALEKKKFYLTQARPITTL